MGTNNAYGDTRDGNIVHICDAARGDTDRRGKGDSVQCEDDEDK